MNTTKLYHKRYKNPFNALEYNLVCEIVSIVLAQVIHNSSGCIFNAMRFNLTHSRRYSVGARWQFQRHFSEWKLLDFDANLFLRKSHYQNAIRWWAWTHFINDFAIAIQIRWKFPSASIQLLENYATAVLPWHLQNFKAIWYPTMELYYDQFPSNFNYDGKFVRYMGPRRRTVDKSTGRWWHTFPKYICLIRPQWANVELPTAISRHAISCGFCRSEKWLFQLIRILK